MIKNLVRWLVCVIKAILGQAVTKAEFHEISEERNYYHHLYRHYKTWQPPGHFYSPIPNLKELEKSSLPFNRSKQNLPGVDLNESGQLNFLDSLSRFYKDFDFPLNKATGTRFYLDNPAFSHLDALHLYAAIRHFEPKRIIEVGSGYSSALILDTNERFFGGNIDLTFVEPYPQLLKKLMKKSDRKHDVISKPIQEVDLKIFDRLHKNDILFIDSTHVSKTGSDVNTILFEIIPRLRKGVIIHFHDVFYPFEYPEDWILQGRAWNEDYFLRAFLQFNGHFKVLLFNDFIGRHHRSKLKNLPSTFRNTSVKKDGGSLWLEKIL